MAWLLKRLVLAALALSSLSSAAEWDDVRDCDGGCDDNDHDEETLFQMSAVLLKQGEQAPQVPQAFDEMATLAQLSQEKYVFTRHKFENKQEQRDEQVLRLRVDIADFHLKEFLSAPLEAASLPSAVELSGGALSVSSSEAFLGPAERLQELWQSAAAFQAVLQFASGPWPPSRLVACAKHLCGGATDIALRSLKAFPAEAGSKGGVMVCVATCCHHRCDVDSYVNRPFLEALGLCNSPEDFLQLVSTAGWAVGGEGRRDVQKRRVGMMAKRILDLGRELHLDDASLTEYISKAVTPENMAITAGAAKKPARGGAHRSAMLCCAWCAGEKIVLEEILWATEEPPPMRSKSGCLHILKLEEAQAELQFWLRRLLRDRLDQQRKRILAQGQADWGTVDPGQMGQQFGEEFAGSSKTREWWWLGYGQKLPVQPQQWSPYSTEVQYHLTASWKAMQIEEGLSM
eukprot:g8497.t1